MKTVKKELAAIKEVYPQFKDGNIFGSMNRDEISYVSPVYHYGQRFITVSHNEMGYLLVMTVGNYPTTNERYQTHNEIIEALKFRF